MTEYIVPSPLQFPSAGLLLAAEAWGDEGAVPVLLLHGGGQTRHAWDDTAKHLAALGYRAITLDARGHGESDWDPAHGYQLERFADDLVAVARALDQPPIVVGASLGGYTGLYAVGALGLQLRALVLVDIAPRIEPAGVARIFEFMTAHVDGFASLEDAADAVAEYLPHRRRPKRLDGLRKNLRLGEDGRYRWHYDPAFVTTVRAHRPSDRLLDDETIVRAIDVPTLLVRGKLSDLLSDDGVRHFLDLVPHAEYVDVTGAAHMVVGDENDRFTDAVVAFLGRRAPSGRSA
jgi:pimeloyl-ACP methyl ester carboxylesterase